MKTALTDKTDKATLTMSLTLRINAVWLLTWVQPNTGDYKTINEKVNGTLAIYREWWGITEFTPRIVS